MSYIYNKDDIIIYNKPDSEYDGSICTVVAANESHFHLEFPYKNAANPGGVFQYEQKIVPQFKLKRENIMKDMLSEVKQFFKDNRQVVGYIVMALLLDHFVFGGAMRERLKELVSKMLGKVEKSLDQ